MRRALIALALLASPAAAQTVLTPVESASVHDEPRDGLGDLFNTSTGLIREQSTREDRALQRFDVSSFTGIAIGTATLTGRVSVNNAADNGPRTFDFLLFQDNGALELSDFEIPATVVGSGSYAPPTDSSFTYAFDVTGVVQNMLINGAASIGLRVDATSDPNFPNILSATDSELVITGDLPLAPLFCFGDGSGCTPCPCGNNAPPVAVSGGCLNGSGAFCILLGNGDASATNDTLQFDVTGANPDTFAVLVSADNRLPNNPANPCFGTDSGVVQGTLDGLRCIGGNLVRHGSRALNSSGANTNPWGGPGNPPQGLIAQGGFSIGQTRHFQCFYREDAVLVCQTGQNTSQGWSVTVGL